MENAYIVIIDGIFKCAFSTEAKAKAYIQMLKESLLSNDTIEELLDEVDDYESKHDIMYDSYLEGILDIHPDLDWLKDKIKDSLDYYDYYDINNNTIVRVNYYRD